MPIAKSTAGPSLLAQVAVSKYLDYVGFPVM
jgi:transposase